LIFPTKLMELISTIARVFGSLTIEMSTVQSVQFTHGVDGVMCLLALTELRLWTQGGYRVRLETRAKYREIVF